MLRDHHRAASFVRMSSQTQVGRPCSCLALTTKKLLVQGNFIAKVGEVTLE